MRNGSLGRDLAKGVIAGTAATAALVATRNVMYAREDPAVREREEDVRGDSQVTPLQKPVRMAAETVGQPVHKETEERVGNALAWGMSIGFVAAYAGLRKRVKGADAGQGLAFGLGAWLIEDELMMPLLGLAPGPGAYPWQAHARGLAAHLAYGVVAETTLDALDRAA